MLGLCWTMFGLLLSLLFLPVVNIISREFEDCRRKCKSEYESQSVQSVAGKLYAGNGTALKRWASLRDVGRESLSLLSCLARHIIIIIIKWLQLWWHWVRRLLGHHTVKHIPQWHDWSKNVKPRKMRALWKHVCFMSDKHCNTHQHCSN